MECLGEIGGLGRFTSPSQQTEFYEGGGDDFAQTGPLLLRRQFILLLRFVLCHVTPTGSSFSQKRRTHHHQADGSGANRPLVYLRMGAGGKGREKTRGGGAGNKAPATLGAEAKRV